MNPLGHPYQHSCHTENQLGGTDRDHETSVVTAAVTRDCRRRIEILVWLPS